MDPNKTVENMRELAIKILKDYEDPESNGIDQDEACELASYIETLDVWLCRGGFLPQDWAREDVTPERVGAILGGVTSRCLDDNDDFRVVRDAIVDGLS